MFLTKKQLETIAQQIASISVKDSDFQETFATKYGDSVAIVQDGVNKRIDLSELGKYFASVSDELIPDNEDITVRDGTLSFADRSSTHGMGYVILRRDKTFAEQVTQENTIYEIRYDFDLDGGSVTVLSGCVLKFNGGKLSNGTIVGTNAVICADAVKIFGTDLTVSGTWRLDKALPEWFGAVADNSTDCTAPIQKCIDAFNIVNLNRGIYKTTETIFVKTRTCITGIGTGANSSGNQSIIKKYHTTAEDVDAVLSGPSSAVSYLSMRDFALESNGYNTDYGFYFGGGINQSGFENLYIFKCKVGFYAAGTVWNIRMNYVICNSNTLRTPATDSPYGYESGSEGFNIACSGGGTTLNMNQCWARDCHRGYSIQAMSYSTLIGCGADNICDRPWWIKACTGLAMIGCAMESCIARSMMTISGGRVTIIGFSSYQLWPANDTYAYMLFASDSAYVKIESSNFVEWQSVDYSVTKFGLTGRGSWISTFDVSAPSSVSLDNDMTVQGSSANGITTRKGNKYNYIYTDAINVGDTASRPVFDSNTHKGFQYFDETLGQPIWWTGSAWVDASGETA